MAYDYLQLFNKIDRILSMRPKMTLCELARKLQVGTRTLREIVKSARGKSFREYQKEKILQRSDDLIASAGELLEKQIALDVGYRSPDAFSRFIRRTTGGSFKEKRGRRHVPPSASSE